MRTIVLFGSIILFPLFFGIVIWSFFSLGLLAGFSIFSAFCFIGYMIYRSNRKAFYAEINREKNIADVEPTISILNQYDGKIDKHLGKKRKTKKGFYTTSEGKLVIERERNDVYELQICFIPIFLPFTVFELYLGDADGFWAGSIGLAILIALYVSIFYKSFVVIDSSRQIVIVRRQIHKWFKEQKYFFSDIMEVELFHSSIEGTNSYDARLRGTTKIHLRGYGEDQENAKQLQSEVLKHIQLPETARTLTHWYGIH